MKKPTLSDDPPHAVSKAWKKHPALFQALENFTLTFSNPWKKRSIGFPTLGKVLLLALLLCGSAMAKEKRLRPGVSAYRYVEAPAHYVQRDSWLATMQATREALLKANAGREAAAKIWERLDRDFPVGSDWMLQALGTNRVEWFSLEGARIIEQELFKEVVEELGPKSPLAKEVENLFAQNPPRSDPRWLELFCKVCEQRRAQRLKTVLRQAPRIVFTKHFNMGGSHYAYTEAQSDAQHERNFFPGSELCLLEFKAGRAAVTTLLDDDDGVIRDPNISWDGKKILFAWKKSNWLDDYHLYEMDVATRAIRQLTFGLGCADYEGAYLPDGDIIFNSTRPVQTVDCFTTEVSNLYTCDPFGRFLRRLGFDQVHVNYPQVLDDGRVTYTRWEYQDRGQVFVQGLFQMNPDGTAQTEFYGNNSWFPTSLLHARGIPGTRKVAAIASGHHSSQAGKLVIVDPDKGRQENTGVQLIAPARETAAVKVDAYGQSGPLWMYPYPLNEQEFLVAFAPQGRPQPHDRFTGHFSIFWMDADGRRELLASDPGISCNQPVPLIARTPPRLRPSLVDYRKNTGTYYMQNVYEGPGLQDVPHGAAKALRVVAIDYRAAIIGENHNGGEAGGALISTPPSIGNGAWDPKRVLGTTPIQPDGSAMFTVPARTPVYFQVLDASNHVIQTMRSWSTLQPGETFACVGCHENKNAAPPSGWNKSAAYAAGAQPLQSFQGLETRGFSFAKDVQPILDAHCIKCHDGGATERGKKLPDLTGKPVVDSFAKRIWTASYITLTHAKLEERNKKIGPPYRGATNALVNWVHAQSAPPMLPPYACGSSQSGLLGMLERGHGQTKLSRDEIARIACWIDLAVPFCGDYTEANAWTDAEKERYAHFMAKRSALAAVDARNINELLTTKNNSSWAGLSSPASATAQNAGLETPPTFRIMLMDGRDKILAEQSGSATPSQALTLDVKRDFQPGDRIRISAGTNATHLAVTLDPTLGEAIIYAAQGLFEFPLPDPKKRVYPPAAFAGSTHTFSARPLAPAELDGYRNLARNPYDVRVAAGVFPHATSTNEYHHMAQFEARCAIDGFADNRKHGTWPFQSWGPEKDGDMTWRLDFGRKVQIDKVVITLRADFPHDHTWTSGALVFGDGHKVRVDFQHTAEPQVIHLPRNIETDSVRLVNLKQDSPPGWCALTEFETWGRDPLPIPAGAATQ
jgi:hypothetical protein